MRLQQARPMTPEELRSTGSQPDVSEGAEAPDPKVESVTLTITTSPDLLGIVKGREIEQTLRRLVDRTWGSGVTVDRVAPPSAPDPEGLPSVERLAEALHAVGSACPTVECFARRVKEEPDASDYGRNEYWPSSIEGSREAHRKQAEAILARLSPVDTDTEPTE